jgi:hypothetical protein
MKIDWGVHDIHPARDRDGQSRRPTGDKVYGGANTPAIPLACEIFVRRERVPAGGGFS